MSEEILKALMQLFAIIAKQDEGVELSERAFVVNFLNQQINDEAVQDYIHLFEEHAGLLEKDEENEEEKGKIKLTSVKDSVRILGICKKINKTLTQKQKIVVLVRLFELINADRKFSEQRMAIINTVAEVFKLTKEEFTDIENFVIGNTLQELDTPSVLTIHDKGRVQVYSKYIPTESLDGFLAILQIKSVDLYFLRYTGSADIFLNGLPINNKRIYLYASGSSIRLPKGKPVYYTDVVSHYLADSSITKISYRVNNLGYTFKTGGTGLRNISFAEEHGKLIGIMGASGAGKTTLLNVLSGNEAPSTGEVLINGINLHTDRNKLEGVIGVIPQDDLLIEELTVFENLYYNAKLCFKDKSDEEITELVEKTLSSLGLLERKNLKVGSSFNKMISGGQRKRLNIALELIREPSILFVDEPTSGLSSRDSENVMDLLRELTLKGKLIYVVIHQPSSDIYKMFDNMMILDTGGYMTYYGNPVEAVMYFKRIDDQINSEQGECPTCGNVNPELIFNIVEAKVVDEFGQYTPIRKVSPGKWEEYFKENIRMKRIEDISVPPPVSLNIPSRLKQFVIYTIRDFRSKISNTQYIALNLLETPLLAFILSYVIRYIANPTSDVYIFRENENIQIYIFMALIVSLFVGLTVSAEEIFRDRKILKREAFLNLSRSSYLLAKITILIVISAIQSLLFVLIANNVLGIQDMGFVYWFALFTTAVFANILGLNISATFNAAVTIYIVIPLIMIPMMVLSGAMFSFEKLNRTIGSVNKVPLIADMMATKWAYEALMVHQFKDNGFESYFYNIEKEESQANYKFVWYVPELQKRAEQSLLLLDKAPTAESKAQMADYLAVLKRAISKEAILVPSITFENTDDLVPESYTIEVAAMLSEYLEKLLKHYDEAFQQANSKKDAMVNYFQNKNKALYNAKKMAYHNESVSDLVLKIFEKNKILQFGDELVQQYEPIFRDPERSSFFGFRSHFLAPRKYFMGTYWDTFWFNMSMIWFMTLTLYVTLYFELLKKLIEGLSEINLKKLRLSRK
ncbi:ATP-binding cassette domain-containing protein [Williamwhitmania taraxaci]|uniref:ABC-type multidrug transport system, ATPase component n=1 Tax=Williamwhitmania taraxaci TaxID=1640674 RepID=A0A1G6PQD3_9BACT|nr:ATP-binding cassette domain-containing protein [Williamwhitmania taraxaci]SDC82383.1 ABC-type multidrug transport system, ATPase component [Williamwhitmania taraxaci]